jgi:type I restriction enzyme, S subunit
MNPSPEGAEQFPENWEMMCISDFACASTERVNPKLSRDSPYIGLEHIDKDTGKLVGKGTAADVVSTKSVFREGDLLYGKLRPYLNKVWIAEFDGFCSTDILVFPMSEAFDNKFLKYRLLSQDFVSYANANSSGVNLPRVSSKVVGKFKINLPPLPEQRRIVARIEELFSRLDAGAAALRQAKAQLQRYRQSVLAAAVTGQLTQAWREQHPDTEPATEHLKAVLKKRREMWEGRRKYVEPSTPDTNGLPNLPITWTWATVAQQSDPDERAISDGPFGSKLKSSHYTDSGPRVFRLQNIGDGFFKDEYAHISEQHFKTLLNHEIFSGDLLIKALGIPAHQTCMVPPGVGPAIVKADCIRFKVFEPYINARFALLALNSHPVRTRSEKMIHGVGRPRLNGSEIKQIALPFPPLAEQHQIVAEVEARTAAIDHLEAELDRQITRSNRLRQSTLGSAFYGKL